MRTENLGYVGDGIKRTPRTPRAITAKGRRLFNIIILLGRIVIYCNK